MKRLYAIMLGSLLFSFFTNSYAWGKKNKNSVPQKIESDLQCEEAKIRIRQLKRELKTAQTNADDAIQSLQENLNNYSQQIGLSLKNCQGIASSKCEKKYAMFVENIQMIAQQLKTNLSKQTERKKDISNQITTMQELVRSYEQTKNQIEQLSQLGDQEKINPVEEMVTEEAVQENSGVE